jgi:hypothetical protein
MFGDVSKLERDDLPAIAAAIYAPPPAPKPQLTFDDAAMEKLLALLADLGAEPDFQEPDSRTVRANDSDRPHRCACL